MLKSKAGFITKLQAMLDNPNHQQIIRWSNEGSSFFIFDPIIFEQSILTNYFRHKKMSSFIRQLNMYGFHKCRGDKSILEFMHPLFLKSNPYTHSLIERRRSVDISLDLGPQINYISAPSIKQFQRMLEEPQVIQQIHEEQDALEPQSRFRLNGSQMTIRLNEKLTSLCNIEWNEIDEGKIDEKINMVYSSERILWNSEKKSQIDTLMMTESGFPVQLSL